MRRQFLNVSLDSAVIFALATRLWGLISSFVNLTLIIYFLSKEEQGYYYTFSTLLGAQILFELGMGVVLTHFASHTMALLNWLPDGRITGPLLELSRLSSLVKLIFRWYGLISILVVLILGPAGWIFLKISQNGNTVIWEMAWVLLIATTPVNLFVQPLMSLLEGCQCVSQVARIRLIQGIVGSLASWITLYCDGGLYALAAWSVATAMTAVIALSIERRLFFKQMLFTSLSDTYNISWKKEVWPFQWRIAVSWISGYFIFQIFVPVLFATQGPVEAGRMGLSLAVASALMGLPLAWFNTKVPSFGKLIALRDYEQLDSLWRRVTKVTFLTYCAGGIVIVVLTYFLQSTGTELGRRLLTSGSLTLLIAATGVNYLTIAQASYLRAHKEEPFLWVSLVYGILVSSSTLLLAKNYGSVGVLIGYLVCSFVCGTIWASVIFQRKRRMYRENAI
jgi:hypothetical protein